MIKQIEQEILQIDKMQIPTVFLNTVIIGSGAAGFNSALSLYRQGVKDIAIVTEDVNCGTSRNTGSDKQTYFKMSLCSDFADSPVKMAETLFKGGCVDEDNAFVESALSVRSFMRLCELGVDFPSNRYGEYIGYKTDHDDSKRATSVGPLTSKMMTTALEKAVVDAKIEIFDRKQAIAIVGDGKKVLGLLTLDKNNLQDENNRFMLFCCTNIIIATGGPAGIYKYRVYPDGHHGSSSLAFLAGAKGQNLTEWQYGLASVAPKWNVSGTYMQVLPRMVSVDEKGNEFEFLSDLNLDEYKCLSLLFQKGYNWPFDGNKINESSKIDLLVYEQTHKLNRKVYLDFTKNPFGIDSIDIYQLDDEVQDYLTNARVELNSTPVDRLKSMNQPAFDLYLSKGVDLTTEKLEIALCAQHNNGGIAVDLWWQTNIEGLFAVGEVAGTHGIRRPGGSALNAGQVGSYRAACYIAQRRRQSPLKSEFEKAVKDYIKQYNSICKKAVGTDNTLTTLMDKMTGLMSKFAGPIRQPDYFGELISKAKNLIDNFEQSVKVESFEQLPNLFVFRDVLISQITFLSAMNHYIENSGKSRGGAVYSPDAGKGISNSLTQMVTCNKGKCECHFRPVRTIEKQESFFENVWKSYRENKNVY